MNGVFCSVGRVKFNQRSQSGCQGPGRGCAACTSAYVDLSKISFPAALSLATPPHFNYNGTFRMVNCSHRISGTKHLA